MSGGSLVLTYHRIAAGRDPLGQCVHPERFADQLTLLAVSAEIVPLAELGGSSRQVALTFDDGYADNAATAAPLLRAHDAAATFFVPSRVLDDPREYWWDRLEHAHFDGDRPASVDVEIGGRRVRIDVRDDEGRLRSIKALSRRLRPLPLDAVDDAVAAIAAQLGAEPAPCDAHALLTASALRELAADPLFTLGSHGVTHTMLSALTPEEQERAGLGSSRVALESLIATAPTAVAYPFGTLDAIDDATMHAAAVAGYSHGYVNVPGRIDLRRAALAQPRHMVHDWPAAEFAAQLDRWFAAL